MEIKLLKIASDDSRLTSQLQKDEIVEHKVQLSINSLPRTFTVFLRANVLPQFDAGVLYGDERLEELLRFEPAALSTIYKLVGQFRRGNPPLLPHLLCKEFSMSRRKIDIIALPDDSESGGLLEVLVSELSNSNWTSFQAAVAFLKGSGNNSILFEKLDSFLVCGKSVALTFGADSFQGDTYGSNWFAAETILSHLGHHEKFDLFLFRDSERTFHPKVYFFKSNKEALVIIGSSNWSYGGLLDNVEMNVTLSLDLDNPDDHKVFEKVERLFSEVWQNPANPFLKRLTMDNLNDFSSVLDSREEKTVRKTKSINTGDSIASELFHGTSFTPDKKNRWRKSFSRKVSRKTKNTFVSGPQKTTSAFGPQKTTDETLLWKKTKLSKTDGQRQKGNPTGDLRLTQSHFTTKYGEPIDQTTYFKEVVFADGDWKRVNEDVITAEFCFALDIEGQEEMIVERLTVSHKPTGEAGQGNYTTGIRWGTSLIERLRHNIDISEKCFELHRATLESEYDFYIKIYSLD